MDKQKLVEDMEYEMKAAFREEYTEHYLDFVGVDISEKLWCAFAKGFLLGAKDAVERMKN